MTTDLNAFLEDETGIVDAGSPDPPIADITPVDGGKSPAPDSAAPTDPKPPVADPAPAADPPEEIPEDVRGLRAALGAERNRRNDHKGRADRAEGELTATKAELEALRKAPPVAAPAANLPPPSPPVAARPYVIPNPAEDPEGFHRHQQQVIFNERLNTSEAMLREKVDGADVDAKLAIFKQAAEADPRLRVELARQVHPYKWAYEQASRIQAMNEIGTDPAAYRARVEAEIRAAIAAGGDPGASAAAVIPASVQLPRSLATATSAAPRMAAIEAAPEFEDIFKPRVKASR